MRIISLLLFVLLSVTQLSASNNVKTIKGLVQRILPDYQNQFVFKQVDSKTGNDTYAFYSHNGKIVIEGNSANSMAVGLNQYLRRYCLTTISWYKDDPIEMPKTLPMVPQRVEGESRMPIRFFLNYCTYGYTMPWWTWRDWEHFIDWMALNGVNMPLAITGQESVWYNVWQKFGLTDLEIREFFGGPAYLGWHRMSNFDNFMGPLPIDWMDKQEEMQKKIVAREREFNMQPVLPAFAGHIPSALLKHYPDMEATPVSDWGDFKDPEKYRCTFLSSTDPMFTEIQKEFIKEQTRLYGTSHVYGIDPFNEIDPPTLDPDSLSMIANGIYRSIADIDPEALWLQMGWTFKFKPYWTNERQRALFKGVPQDKLLLLDYWCENKEMWVKTESYFGQPFLWCYLNNFGGRNRLIAPTGIIEERVENVLANGGSNFKGVGATLEGFDVNMFGFEYLLDEAWNQHSTLHEWRNNLADRRMGYTSEDARKVYNDYCSRVLDIHRDYDWTMVENRPTMNFSKREKPNPVRFAQIDVWRQLLELESDKDMFIMDIVNVGRQCLADHFYTLWRKFILAYDTYDIKEMKEIGATMKEILKDNADLVACHPVFSLKKWIDDARAWGTTIEEKDFYERNARRLLTIWNNSMSGINDYAGRPWDGLFQSYYIPRWTMFIDEVIAARTAGVEFNEEDFAKRCFEFEERFCELQEPITYPTAQPALPLAKRLFNKYFAPQK